MKETYSKNISQEISEIETFFVNKSFIIDNINYPTNECLLKTSKSFKKNHIDFNLKLNSNIHPNKITFKKLGFSEIFKIKSQDKTFMIPQKGITKIIGKTFALSENIRGEISSIYSETFPLQKPSNFRLLLKTTKEDLTTIFLGSKYSCGETHYSLGLISVHIGNNEYQIYRHKKDSTNFLVIENCAKVFFNEFRDVCESTLKSIGLITGNWYKDEHYFFSYNSNTFDKIESVYYESFNRSIISNYEIINPQQFRSFINNQIETPLLTDLLFPEEILAKMVFYSKSKPEFERTIELIIEGNVVKSPLIRCSVFSVALETIVSLIHSENKAFFKPLKQTENFSDLLQDLQTIINKAKNNFEDFEYDFLSKKIKYFNTPFNKDRFLLAFNFFNIELPIKLKKVLDTRNKFFHGKTPYEEGLLKTKTKDLHLEADRLHLLVSILILKYIGYKGHIKNNAGYRLELEKIYEEKSELKIEESAFYKI